MSKEKKLSYKQKSSITFVGHDDPPFIKALKERTGYKAAPTIDDKFKASASEGYVENDLEEDDLSMLKEEDRPQVVVLDVKNDLNNDDLLSELNKKREEEDRKKIAERQITFKKPTKRQSNCNDESKGREKKTRTSSGSKQETGKSETRLLSFADDEEDE
ncbi:hypothetical protein AB6A40_004323 [Gnathostoma spinigerum]|uniref:DUF4604 domain-containing protein n=1 Tax=Gnathostoma spinigerum TaxID=75299 RepID=A0ABD6EJU0_9BILA